MRSIPFLLLSLLFCFSQIEATSVEATSSTLTWNSQATRASLASQEKLPFAARSLAILHTAIYDTVQAAEKTRQGLYVKTELLSKPEEPIDLGTAITAAAHSVLTQLYPSMAHEFDEELLRMYAKTPNNASKRDSITLGREVAAQVLAWRSRDLESSYLPFKNSDVTVGRWGLQSEFPPLAPYWATQPFFVIESAAAFPVPPPPACKDHCYTGEYYQVKRIGNRNSHERLADHTALGLFWDPSSVTPIVYWNGIARQLAQEKNFSEQQAAHLLALLNVALADSVMSSWEHKYHYRQWRPQEAIVRAKEVKEIALLADQEWKPLLPTPFYPDYPSAHSACAGAAGVVLRGYVGDHCLFTCNCYGECEKKEESPMRSYHDISTAAKEAGQARVYAGACFPYSVQAGMQLGERIAYYVLENSTQKIKQPS